MVDDEEEVEDENYNFNEATVDSKNYLVNLYRVGNMRLQ